MWMRMETSPLLGDVQKKHNTICLFFYRHPALLLSHRPLRVCSLVTPWLAAKLLRTVYHVISGRLLRIGLRVRARLSDQRAA